MSHRIVTERVSPDLTYHIDDLLGAGDKVVLRWTAMAADTTWEPTAPAQGPMHHGFRP